MGAPSLEDIVEPVEKEKKLVHEVYNAIAKHFSKTRYKPWPIVEKFLMSRNDNSIGIDVGCGNGKYLGINKKLYLIGTDMSEGLIECAHDISAGKYEIGVADGLALPHPSGRFDFAISIAVIHHFANEARRVEAIKHILEKLRASGELLIYCWALEQESSRRGYKEGDNQDVLVPWVMQKQHKKGTENTTNESQSTNQDNNGDEVKYRYYHLYRKGELEANVLAAGSCSIVDLGYEKDNWWVIAKKH